MRISNIITAVLAIIGFAAFLCFLYFPYGELDSIQDKRDHAVGCLYIVIASTLGLVATAIAARD